MASSDAGYIATVQAVGEGYGNERQDPSRIPPIVVQLPKMTQWLQDRQLIKAGWRQSVDVVRDRVAGALRSLPDTASASTTLNEFLAGRDYLSYWDCVTMSELVKQCEAGTRNFFGRYASESVALWDEILVHFKKDGLWLADGAHKLHALIEYDVPMARRQVSSAQAQIELMHGKQTDFAANIAKLRQQFARECARLDIASDAPASVTSDCSYLHARLTDLSSKLPELFGEALRAICLPELVSAVDYYSTFVRLSSTAGAHALPAGLLPLASTLAYFAAGGECAAARVHAGGGAPSSLLEALASADETARGLVTNVLELAPVRSQLVTDLIELSCFLQQRIHEVTTDSGALVLRSRFTPAEQAAMSVSADVLRAHLACAQRALDELNSPRIRNLLMLRNSSRFVERTAAAIHAKLLSAAKLEFELASFPAQIDQAREAIERNTLVVQKTLAYARELRAHLERALGEHFKGRRIEITGVN